MKTGRSRRRPAALGAALLLAGALPLAAPPPARCQQPGAFLVQGQSPPEFALLDTTGKVVQLGDFRGRVILLSFWSCYTDSCFAANAAFDALLAKLGPLGLAAPTVCEEIPPALAAEGYAGLLKRCGVGQTVLVDPERRAGAKYFVREYPTSILIGPEYAIREILPGVAPLRDPAFQARLEELVRKAAARAPSPAP